MIKLRPLLLRHIDYTSDATIQTISRPLTIEFNPTGYKLQVLPATFPKLFFIDCDVVNFAQRHGMLAQLNEQAMESSHAALFLHFDRHLK